MKSLVISSTAWGLQCYRHKYQYTCVITACVHQFRTVRDWNNHHKTFHGTTLQCNKCRKGFKSPSSRHDHSYIHSGQKLTCHKCKKVFCFPSTLQVHLISHQKARLYKCQFTKCKKVYKYRHDLLRHNKCHESVKYQCEQCEDASSECWLLKWHAVQHTDKQYRCPKCNNKYKHYNSLNRHAKKCRKWSFVS